MADEITVNVELEVTNGSFKDSFKSGRLLFDQAAIGASSGVFEIGTTEEAITFNDITTEGWLVMRNLDETNYVQWGPESGGSMVAVGRMEPGEPAILRADPGMTLRLKADTAACKVLIKLLED